MAEWHNLTLASSLNGTPSTRTPAPVIGKLDLLPLGALSWEDFERLQWRVMRDVEGLRHAQLYGDRGQAQLGLDIVALAPDSTGVALQSKQYRRFGAADLKSAVKKFRATKRPFDVERLIIGVSIPVRSTGAVEALAALREELHPIGLELWDAQELSYRLRGRPEIVIEFFGLPTAEAFCLPFKVDVTVVPPTDAVAVREAIARTPEIVTGAQPLFDEAASTDDPSDALALIEAGQAKLRDAGFGAHAAQHDDDRVRQLANLDRTEEAARYLLGEFWAALDQGLSTTARLTQTRLEEISKPAKGQEYVELCRRVTRAATSLYLNPLGHLPDVDSLRIGDQIDQARLFLLAGETALANDDHEWLSNAESALAELANIPLIDRVLRTRLRLLSAEATGDWSGLLSDARKLKLGHDLLGLVTARYARNCAIHQKFEEADLSWDEASGSASLARQWGEASTWIFSRRGFRSHWNPFTSDELLPLQTAIRAMGTSTPLVPADTGAYEDALADLSEEKLRPAAISAQRALRDAVTTSDWVGEDRARRVLAKVLIEADEPTLAAHHLTRAGATKAIEALGRSLPLQFVNIIDDLDAPNYWTVGTSYRLLATQADLIPDPLISQVAEHITAELTAAEAGTYPDLRAFATSRYNNAVKALAGVADRLSPAHADAVLIHFENQSPVQENHYRYHDEDEALAIGKIALSQPALAARAVPQLVTLLGRSQAARNDKTYDAIQQNRALAHDTLAALAQAGNEWAAETLAFEEPDDVAPAVAQQALIRLTTPLKHVKGVYTLGTVAVGDSLLIRHLPLNSVQAAVSELLSRAEDPHIGSSDRGDYLLAASNLAPHLDETNQEAFFATALRLATSPAPSESDDLDAQFTHRLGGFQTIGTPRDSRGQAVFLASVLATSETQRNEVRRLVYTLLGEESDYWPTRALQRLGETVKDDLAFLASQGWAIRSFAAKLWADYGEPTHLGKRLAADPDVRVRRALAHALSEQPETSHMALREQLAVDPAHSVRAALGAPLPVPQVPDTA
ncbi:MAG TPA: hypothetical protein VMA73_25610 [Streptosporangiaceae bacterium]|nr:hypothetical protein [Streptosporangiaceae bacterium]